jgi:hypothetical protein
MEGPGCKECGVKLPAAASFSSTFLKSEEVHHIYLPLLHNRIRQDFSVMLMEELDSVT